MLDAVIKANRKIINAVPCWLDAKTYQHSKARYGCPAELLNTLNKPLNDELTYTDIIVEASLVIGTPLRYLEIGVSVGKNFLAVANAMEDCDLWAMDWESPAPQLAARFHEIDRIGSLTHYTFHHNNIYYWQRDITDEGAWAELQGRGFNIIFSDATHNAGAILSEFRMLEHFELLDTESFFLIWDDLDREPNGPMTKAFGVIAESLMSRYVISADQCFTMPVKGWLGQHEHDHTVGIINNVGITMQHYAGYLT